jgi:hypothetical protein
MTFKFRKGVFIFLFAMTLIYAFPVVIGVICNGFNLNSDFNIIILLLLCIGSCVGAVISMDLMIDEEGMRRTFWGRSVLFLKWSDIKVIKDEVTKGMGAKPVRSFYVIPDADVSLSFWSGGHMKFTGSMYDFRAFTGEINRFVKLHDIKIERLRGVDITLCNEISVSD